MGFSPLQRIKSKCPLPVALPQLLRSARVVSTTSTAYSTSTPSEVSLEIHSWGFYPSGFSRSSRPYSLLSLTTLLAFPRSFPLLVGGRVHRTQACLQGFTTWNDRHRQHLVSHPPGFDPSWVLLSGTVSPTSGIPPRGRAYGPVTQSELRKSNSLRDTK